MRIKRKKNSFKGLRLKTSVLCTWVYALCAVANVWLAFNSEKYSPLYALITTAIIYLSPVLGFLIILQHSKKRKITKNTAVFCILPAIYLLVLVVNTYGGYSGDWIISFITIALFLLMDDQMKSSIFEKFYKIVQVQNVISIIIYLLFILNLRFIFTSVPFYTTASSNAGFYYLKAGIWAIAANDFLLSYRLCGIFNEAGALGTACALLFVATFKSTKTWEKVILLINVALSFSLAGYLLLFVFAAVYLIRKGVRNAIWLVLLWVFFINIPNIDWHNDALNVLARRFSLVDGGLLGDNRTTSIFDARFSELLASSRKWLGYGAGYSLADGVSTYKTYIVEFGIIGMVIILGLWIIAIFKAARKNLDCYVLGLIFIISLYQRPAAIKSLFGYVMIFGGFAYILAMNYNQQAIKEKKT